MREDMDKQIVEKERGGSTFGEPTSRMHRREVRQRLRGGDEDLDSRQSMTAHLKGILKFGGKALNENLNPLYRYLNKQAGRPWNDVFSEICEQIKLDSTVQRHIREHVFDIVKLSIRIIDGVPHHHNPYSRYDKTRDDWTPLNNDRWRGTRGMYVDPEDGLLKFSPQNEPSWKQKERNHQDVWAKSHFSPPGERLVQFHKIKGIWYEVKFREPTQDERARKQFGYWAQKYDLVNRRYLKAWIPERHATVMAAEDVCPGSNMYGTNSEWSWSNYTRAFGRPLMPLSKKQLNSKEIRRMEQERERVAKKRAA